MIPWEVALRSPIPWTAFASFIAFTNLHQALNKSEFDRLVSEAMSFWVLVSACFSLSVDNAGSKTLGPSVDGGMKIQLYNLLQCYTAFFCTKTVVSGSWPIQVLGLTATRYVLVLWQGPVREAPLSADASHWLVYSFCYTKKEATEQLHMLPGGASIFFFLFCFLICFLFLKRTSPI